MSSTRYCDSCKIEVKIGFGGEANWASHIESVSHRKHEASNNAPSNSKLTSFFKRKPPESTATASATSMLSSGFFSPQAGPPIPVNDFSLIIDVDGSPSPIATPRPSAGVLSVSSILSELELVTASLPRPIPEGLETDILARFSGNPNLELEDGQDAWEMADSALNRVIGFGKTVDEIAKIIRRGPLGMDGFCRWLRALVYDLKVDESLLEGKVKRLIDAMITM